MLILKKPRLDFSNIFKEFIKAYNPVVHTPYCGVNDFWGDDYEDYYWNDAAYLQYLHTGIYNCGSSKNKKKGKSKSKSIYRSRGKKSSSKKLGRYNDIDFYEGHSYDDDTDDIISSSLGNDAKTIFFYRDINNPDDYEEFYNLYSFDDFLRSNGIKISDYEVQKILNRDVTHCCSVNQDGDAWLVSDCNYGSLYYEASESLYVE